MTFLWTCMCTYSRHCNGNKMNLSTYFIMGKFGYFLIQNILRTYLYWHTFSTTDKSFCIRTYIVLFRQMFFKICDFYVQRRKFVRDYQKLHVFGNLKNRFQNLFPSQFVHINQPYNGRRSVKR